MVTDTIINPIGKGQLTIPLSWRKSLGIDQKPVRARLEGRSIIIEPLEKTPLAWDVEAISFATLSEETVVEIKASRNSYQKKDTDAFASHDKMWENV